MKVLTDSYTRFFNTKHERWGSAFQGAFKAVHVDNDNQLIHLSRYIHLNPLVSFTVREEDFLKYPWSCFKNYLTRDPGFVNAKIVLNHFKNYEDYLKFIMDRAGYGKELEKIKHLIIEK